VDGLSPATSSSLPPSLRHSTNLLTSNPNASLPQRLDSSAIGLAGSVGGQLTCDQDHDYSDEQQSFDSGLMDHFVESVGTGSGKAPFGPSAPGAINLVSGDTGGVDTTHEANAPSIATAAEPDADLTPDGKGGFSLTSDAQPYWDDCSTRDAVALSGKNIGDELNAAGLSWGWFEGGFRPSTSYADALQATGNPAQPTSTFVPDEFKAAELQKAVPHSTNQGICDTVSPVGEGLGGSGQWGYKDDYIPHHEPFQYYASTANPHHLTVPVNSHGRDTLAGLAGGSVTTRSPTSAVCCSSTLPTTTTT
jgi:phospholipase C